MGRKKVPIASQAEQTLELKPFCYYCDREFDTAKTLIQHQRTKHFNCAECGLKFDTVTGLRVHMLNAYKRTMKEVPNAIPGRENPDIVVHGMEGLPRGIIEEKTRKAQADRAELQREKAERAAARAAEKQETRGDERENEPPRPENEPPAPPEPSPPLAPAPPAISSSVSVPRPPVVELSLGSALPTGMLAGLSPAVSRLLAGEGDGVSPPGGTAAVPGLHSYPVPTKLSGLHPVALRMLAAAGALHSAHEAHADARSPAASMGFLPVTAPMPHGGTAVLGQMAGATGMLGPLSVPGVAPASAPTPGVAMGPMGGTMGMACGTAAVSAMGGLVGVMGTAMPMAGPLGHIAEPDGKRLRLAVQG